MERRLSAILAADVVGYSRLMGANESGTLAALESLRTDFIDPKIASIRAVSSNYRRWNAGGVPQRRKCGGLRGRSCSAESSPSQCGMRRRITASNFGSA